MVNQKIKKIIFFCAFLLLIGIFVVPQFVSSQASLGMEFGTATGLGTRDLKDTITSIVNIALGFLGIIAVIVMLYGGFVWMMAKGEAEKVLTAKKIIINGVIGLAIILSAFGIVTFVVKMMGEATAPGSQTCQEGETRSCSNFGACEREQECESGQWGTCYFINPACDPFGQDIFALTATAPTNNQQLPISNVVVQLTFNNNLASVNLNSGAIIKHCDSPSCNHPDADIQVIGTISSNPKRVEVRPDNTLPEYQCQGWGTTISPAQYPNLACYPYNENENLNWYQVTVITIETSSFRDTGGNSVTCQAGVPCQFKFKIGELVDLTSPTVNLTEAEDSALIPYFWTTNNINLSDNDTFIFRAEATDDAGLATINFFESSLNLGFSQAPSGATQFIGESDIPWDTSYYEAGNVLPIKSEVTDYAANLAESIKQTTLYPAHCYNNSCDEGESCFTNPAMPYNCGEECPACAGSSCSQDPNTCVPNNNACLSNVCIPTGGENECTCYGAPLITNVAPIDGAPGNFITISGQGFGEEEGVVELVDVNNLNSIYVARFPSQVNSSCSDTWTNNQVIIVLPGNIPQALNGYTIRLKALNPYYPTTGPEFLIDVYGDEQGEPTFTINDERRPGLCLVSPNAGQFNDSFNLSGTGFSGTVQSIEFGLPPNNIPALEPNFISNGSASALVPNIANGQVPVLLIVDGEQSNPLAFTVQPIVEQNAPFITNFTPIKGPSGQYVTIYGGNFGEYTANQSSVKFNNVPVDFADFPDECGTDFWHEDFIVVKVPAEATGVDDGPITVVRSDDAAAVSGSNFDYDTSIPLLPGICSLYPQEGSVGASVEIVGEYFAETQVKFSEIVLATAPILGGKGEADIFNVNVPGGANNGEVKVQNIVTPTITSEGWPFIVAEGAPPSGEGTFDYYEWQFTTCADCLVPQVVEDGNCYGQLASPTPPKSGLSGNTQAYVNAVLGVRFNVDMDNSSFIYDGSGQTYIIQKCNGSGLATSTFNPSACTNIAIPPMTTGYPVYSDNTPEYVQARPLIDFNPGYWYRIILTNGLESETENFPLENNLNFKYNGSSVNNAYEWHFRTRLTNEACQPDSVVLEPSSRLQPNNAIERGQTVNYNACGQNSGICAICPDTFHWSWISSHPQAAQINTAIITSQNQLYANDLVQQPDVAYITSTITDFYNQSTGLYEPLLEPIAGAADLNIVAPSPRIEFNPSCDEPDVFPSPNPYPNTYNVCRNAIIQARFVDASGASIEMDQGTLDSDNIHLYCDIIGPNCPTSGVVGVIVPEESGFTFTPANNLAAGIDYTVTLNANEILSLEGMHLVGASGWAFGTGSEICDDFSGTQVSPGYKLFTALNDTEAYYAVLVGQECALLQTPPGTIWSWQSEDSQVASVNNQNSQQSVVTSEGEGTTYIRSTAQIGVNSYTNSGDNGKVDVNLTPITPLTIIDHQPQGNNVCVNALVRIDFSEPIRTGQGQMDPSQFANTVTDGAGNSVSGSWQISGSGSRFDFIPNNYLATSTMYSVKIKAGENGIITASGNQYLTSANCWNSGMIYWSDDTCIWGFGTGEELCAIHNIIINNADNPASTTATVTENESADWLATAYAENNQPLTNPMNYWWISNTAVGVFEPAPTLPGREATTVGQNPFETPVSTDIYTQSTTTLEGEDQTISEPATLTVNPILAGPAVEQTQPQSPPLVCLNSLVSVEFDKHLDQTTVNDNVFRMQRHVNTLNTVPDGILSFDNDVAYNAVGNDYLTVTAASSTHLNLGNEDFMIEAWVKTNDSNIGVILHKWYLTGWWFGVNNGKVWARLSSPQGSASADKQVQSSIVINTNNIWHHVALVADRDGNAQMYVDGVANGNPMNIASVGSLDNQSPAGIGAHADGHESLNGSLASVRLYKFGLGGLPQNISAIIAQHYHDPNYYSDLFANLAGDWEFNEGEGDLATDFSPYGQNMQFAGTPPPAWGNGNLPYVGSCVAVAQKSGGQQFFFSTIIARFINNTVGKLFTFISNLAFKSVLAFGGNQGGNPPSPTPMPTAGYWCDLGNYGNWVLENSALYSTVKYQLNQLLPQISWLRVKIMGGENGVKAVNGWPLVTTGVAPVNLNNGNYVYSFETGDNYCALDHVNVSVAANDPSATQWLFNTPEDNTFDNNPATPTFDTVNNDSDKVYYASGYDVNGQEITRVAGVYDWVWSWTAVDTSVASIVSASNTPSYAIIGAENQSGETEIIASANSPVYGIDNLTGTAQATVDLCQNPWPEREPNVVDVPKYIDDDYNFALRYCRDSGEIGTTDDLPALDENDFVIEENTPASTIDDIEELLKEYLIPVPTTGDVIGLRIYENSHHLTPQAWYQQNIENPGSPLSKTIDGYPALEDGRTTYVGAVNIVLDMSSRMTLGPSQIKVVNRTQVANKDKWFAKTLAFIKDNFSHLLSIAYGQGLYGNVFNLIDSDVVYTNIYLLSYNQGAEAESTAIINQLLENWEFNVNIGDNELKQKIVKDYQRLTDLIGIAKALDDYHSSYNNYLTLPSGSFIAGMSTSKWPSWNQTLGPALGMGMPTDPINTFNACIDCEEPVLINGGFEATTSLSVTWTEENNVTAVTTTLPQFVHSGGSAASVTATIVKKGIKSSDIELISNTTYEISAWVYVEDPNRAQLNFTCNTDCGTNYGNEWFTPPDYTGWFQLKNRLITPSATTQPVPIANIYLRSFVSAAHFYADDVTIQTAGGNCGYDPQTCWNPEGNSSTGAFSCDGLSYLYSYKSLGPSNYQLSAKMEAVEDWTPDETLDSHVNSAMTLDNVAVCNVTSGSCGDGQVNPPDEQCEPNIGMSYNFCPSGVNWWSYVNPPGCNSSCGWVNPLGTATCGNKTTVATCCGGYCGDGVLNQATNGYNITPNEQCDASVPPYGIDGFANGVSNGSNDENQYACSPYCQDMGGWCGDGMVETAYEQCDGYCQNAPAVSCGSDNDCELEFPIGNVGPCVLTGLSNWTCQSGAPSCGTGVNACRVQCSSGTPYQGSCGDGYVQDPPEVCDTAGYGVIHGDCAACSSFTCDTGWDDCDDQLTNGCEADLNSLETCGGCDNACLPPTSGHGSAVCNVVNPSNPAENECSIVCDTGYSLSNGDCYGTPYINFFNANPATTTSSTIFTWSSVNTTGCSITKSGVLIYSGPITSGSFSYTPPVSGSATYVSSCSNLSSGLSTSTSPITVFLVPTCGNNQIDSGEQCDIGGNWGVNNNYPVNLNNQTCFSRGYLGGNLYCSAACQFNEIFCCGINENQLHFKFTGDDYFSMLFNGQTVNSSYSSYYPWKAVYEGSANLQVGQKNLIAFQSEDIGGCFGMVGSMSCKQNKCQKVCFKGMTPGKICNSNADCPGLGATCYTPTVSGSSTVGNNCTNNSSCDSAYSNNSQCNNLTSTSVINAGCGLPSTCLPDNNEYLALTNVFNNIDWKCLSAFASTAVPSNWNTDPNYDDSSWLPPEESICPSNGAWSDPASNFNWGHKVPSATIIKAQNSVVPVYYDHQITRCRLVIDLTGYAPPPPPPPTSPPATISANPLSPNAISVSWGSVVSATLYKLQKKVTTTDCSTLWSADDIDVTGTNYNDSGLMPSTKYCYRVKACNAGGCSANYSASDSAVTPAAIGGTPSAPTCYISNASSNQIDFYWQPTAPLGGTYNVQYSTTNEPYNWATLLSSYSSSSYSHQNLNSGSYYYHIQACNGGNCSSWGTICSAVVPPAVKIFLSQWQGYGDFAAQTGSLSDFNENGPYIADLICTDEAVNNGYSNTTWKAWLSRGGLTDANDRLIFNDNTVFKLMNGTIVANTKNEFYSANHLAQINVGANNVVITNPSQQHVWTGTDESGEGGLSCNGWTATYGTNAIKGEYDQISTCWTKYVSGAWPLCNNGTDNSACNISSKFYCLEQSQLISSPNTFTYNTSTYTFTWLNVPLAGKYEIDCKASGTTWSWTGKTPDYYVVNHNLTAGTTSLVDYTPLYYTPVQCRIRACYLSNQSGALGHEEHYCSTYRTIDISF